MNGSLLVGMNRWAQHVVVRMLRIVIVIVVCRQRAIGGIIMMVVLIGMILFVEELRVSSIVRHQRFDFIPQLANLLLHYLSHQSKQTNMSLKLTKRNWILLCVCDSISHMSVYSLITPFKTSNSLRSSQTSIFLSSTLPSSFRHFSMRSFNFTTASRPIVTCKEGAHIIVPKIKH